MLVHRIEVLMQVNVQQVIPHWSHLLCMLLCEGVMPDGFNAAGAVQAADQCC